MEFTHSIVLFSGDDGLPLEFNVRNTNEKSLLKAMIEHGGGLCTQSDSAVHLISPGTKELSSDLGKKLVSSRYIFDCVHQNYLLEVNDYGFIISEEHSSVISDEDEERGSIGDKSPKMLKEKMTDFISNIDFSTTNEKESSIDSSLSTPSKLSGTNKKSLTSSNQSESFIEAPSSKMSRSNPSTSRACNWRDDFVPEEIWLDEEEDNTMPFPDKPESKDSEIGLYDDLFESDIKRSVDETKVASDYQDLQKQISHLKSLVAEKDSKLTTMTHHYTNVKKNICSLYKTAKIEIDHKDALLAEANSRLDEILFQRNMTVDQLQRQNTSASRNKSFKSNEEMPAKGENPEESEVLSKSLSKSDNRTVDQPLAKRKRSSSPATPTSSDNKSPKPENTSQNKKHNRESKNASQNPNSVIQDNLIKEENVSHSDSSKKIQTRDAKENQDIAPSKVNSVEKNCDLNSELSSESNQEPSIAEVFARMRELAYKDPEATNAVFFNLLPAQLRESFLEFEKTQVNALNKLKLSFVSCYFSQCSGGTSEEDLENEPQSSTSFFFQDMSSKPKSESCSSSSAAVYSSESTFKSQENNKAKKDSDQQKSGKISTSTEIQINSSQPKNESGSNSAAVNNSEPKSKSQEIIEVKKDSDLQKSRKRSTLTTSFNSSDSISKPQEIITERNSDLQTLGKVTTSTISFDSKCKSQENHKEVKNSSEFQKSRKRSTSTISFNSSDSKSKPPEIKRKETEAIKGGDLQKSTKISKKRHISPRKAAKLYKYNDDKLTLYTQRQLNRR